MDMGKELFLNEFLFLMLPSHCLSLGLDTQKVIVSRVTMYELLVFVKV